MKGDNSALYDNKRTVFVGNLPFDVKVRYLRVNACYCSNQPFSFCSPQILFTSLQDEEIYQLFSGMKEFGSTIEAVRVIRDPNTLLGKGIAYVLFKTRVYTINFSCISNL